MQQAINNLAGSVTRFGGLAFDRMGEVAEGLLGRRVTQGVSGFCRRVHQAPGTEMGLGVSTFFVSLTATFLHVDILSNMQSMVDGLGDDMSCYRAKDNAAELCGELFDSGSVALVSTQGTLPEGCERGANMAKMLCSVVAHQKSVHDLADHVGDVSLFLNVAWLLMYGRQNFSSLSAEDKRQVCGVSAAVVAVASLFMHYVMGALQHAVADEYDFELEDADTSLDAEDVWHRLEFGLIYGLICFNALVGAKQAMVKKHN